MTRYEQQLKLKEVGPAGQKKLGAAKVLCIGAGGLGSPLLLYLAAAGIGHIGIVDHDVVELSNLHRQIIYKTSDIGRKKALVAKEHLLELNPTITVTAYVEHLTSDNAKALIKNYDIVTDCTDNFDTHYLINDTCFALDKPYVFSAIAGFEGQCTLFLGKKTPCYRCMFPTKPTPSIIPNCREGGVLGVLPGFFGVMQANEIIQWILHDTSGLAGILVTANIATMTFRQFNIARNPECSCHCEHH